ncbi:MAG: hypothetical protein IKQ75_09110 [Bacteroidales bacterium]|nr:hypothetical protein [Bacteroidales bacterium]
MTTNYDDIINLPHHVSKKHPQMPMIARAAQFAPFSALTGYGEEIRKSAKNVEETYEEEDYFSQFDNEL